MTTDARFARVRDYVRQHPGCDLALPALARVAHLSPYHFHRMFKLYCGETVGQFVQRTRVTLAAAALRANRNLTVAHAASHHGYESADGFSRAFRRQFGMTPSSWNRSDPLQERKIGRDSDQFPVYAVAELSEQVRRLDLAPTIVYSDAVEVSFVRVADAYRNTDRVMEYYRELLGWYRRTVGGAEPQLFGTSWDDPDLTPLERCTFEWAVAVPPGVKLLPGSALRTIPAMTSVRMPVVGGLDLEDLVWQYLYRVWLPESTFTPAHAPAMEIYNSPPDITGWETFDLWCALPLAPRR